jgi:signal transduction histidine kinase
MRVIRRLASMQLYRMLSLRLLCAYFLVFAVPLIALLASIGWVASAEMTNQTDRVLAWKLRYFRTLDDADLVRAIGARLEYEHMHPNYYGLFDRSGTPVAGDVLALPPRLPGHDTGLTLAHTLAVASHRSPIVRVMTDTRPDGRTLLVAQDMTHVLNVSEAITTALIVGGLFCLLASGAVGVAIGVRQRRRIGAIRDVAQQVARGDLSRRFPVGGRDEIDMLSHLVNRMLDEIERLMVEVKGACDGIAHDLRTPLAHVRSLIVRTAEHPRVEQHAPLGALLDEARQETDTLLARFKAILRVAEIAGLRHRGGFDTIDLRALVLDIGELYAPLAESRDITLAVAASEVPPLHADRALLFEMLGILVGNALVLSRPGGEVRVRLATTGQGPRIEIRDMRAGPPRFLLPDSDAYNAVPQPDDAGLQLSIAWAVARSHDFAIRVADASAGMHVTIDCWPQMSFGL